MAYDFIEETVMTDFSIGARDEHARYPVHMGDELAGHLFENQQSGCSTMRTSHPRLPSMDGRKFPSVREAKIAFEALLNCDHKWIGGGSFVQSESGSIVKDEQHRFCRYCELHESRNASGSDEWEPERIPALLRT